MEDRKFQFLKSVLGDDGACALRKAVERREDLGNALVPRTILSWIGIAARTDYRGALPGLSNTYVSFKKGERGYTGEVTVDDDVYGFRDASLYHVASAIAVVMGVDGEKVPERLRDVDLARLGKNIDLLVKARVVTEELLQKKMLDQAAGYQFSHQHGTSAGLSSTTINVHSPQGEHIGYATFHHQAEGLVPFGVYVDDEHQRKGIASHMYSMAQKLTGKPVMPSKTQTPEGAALWQGNAQQKQFGAQPMGKVELPGQTAKPTEAAGPLEATPPTKQMAQPKPPATQKPKPPTAPKVKSSIPGLPKLTSLKLSEKQLQMKCPACAGSQMKGGRFVGCLCWRELSKSTKVTKLPDGNYELAFGKNWDRDAIETFLEGVRVKT